MTDPLVLLPGMGCNGRLWTKVRSRLPDGQVSTPDLDEDTLDACVASLLATLPERFSLAGVSLGGIVAMALVRQAPRRVSRLCLLSTNPHGPTSAQLSGWQAQREALRTGRTARQLQADLLPVLVRPDRQHELADEILTMADEVGEHRLEAQLLLQATRVDERDSLRMVDVPTLIIAAEHDALCPVSRHEEMRELIGGSDLVVLPDTGHLSTMERPEQVADAMRTWLTP